MAITSFVIAVLICVVHVNCAVSLKEQELQQKQSKRSIGGYGTYGFGDGISLGGPSSFGPAITGPAILPQLPATVSHNTVTTVQRPFAVPGQFKLIFFYLIFISTYFLIFC